MNYCYILQNQPSYVPYMDRMSLDQHNDINIMSWRQVKEHSFREKSGWMNSPWPIWHRYLYKPVTKDTMCLRLHWANDITQFMLTQTLCSNTRRYFSFGSTYYHLSHHVFLCVKLTIINIVSIYDFVPATMRQAVTGTINDSVRWQICT